MSYFDKGWKNVLSYYHLEDILNTLCIQWSAYTWSENYKIDILIWRVETEHVNHFIPTYKYETLSGWLNLLRDLFSTFTS